jgi:hypothetical protein
MGSNLRPIYSNALSVFLFLSAVLISHTLALFKSDENEFLLLLIGDAFHFFKSKYAEN